MPASDGVATGENLRLHRTRHVHEMDAAAARLCGLWRRWNSWFFPTPRAKHFFDCSQHGGRIEIADHQEQRVLRRIEIVIDGKEVVAFVSGDLLFGGRDLRVRVGTEKNLSQALAGQEARLRAVELYLF